MTGLQAQPQHPGPPPAKPDSDQIQKMLTDLTTALSLTDMQTKEISRLYENHFNEMENSMENRKDRRGQHHRVMEESRRKLETDVAAVLNEKQKVLYDEFLEKRSLDSKQGEQGISIKRERK